MKLLKITITILPVVFFCMQVKAQSTNEELATQLANPVANLISLPIQNNLDMGIGEYGGSRLITNVQPVIPFTLSENWLLITRTILPIISQYSISASGNNESGLGDAVISTFFSPTSGIVWGIGPAFLVPTGTDDFLTAKKWGAGPTIVVLTQKSGFTYGILANQVWSFAGDDERSDVNQAYFFPFLSYNWKSGAGAGLNLEWTQNWKKNTSTIYLTPILSGITTIGKQKISLAIGPHLPIGSDTPGEFGLRGNITFIFPK